MTQESISEKVQGTTIVLKQLQEDLELFELSPKQLVFLLRTKTAIGNTIPVWIDDINLTIKLTHINKDGTKTELMVPFKYLLPSEIIPAKDTISIDQFNEWNNKDRTDQERRNKLADKLIIRTGDHPSNNKIVRSWACFVPKRADWKQLTSAFVGEAVDDEWLKKFHFIAFHPGITVSVKGMPTGIIIPNPVTRDQSSWPQFFMHVEDRGIKFDIGRKALRGRQSATFKGYAETVFNEFTNLFKYIAGDGSVIPQPWDKETVIEEIKQLIDLDDKTGRIKLKKSPKDQEASVFALFFEMLGLGIIQDIVPLSAGYRRKYDLYAMWEKRTVVVEFKSKLRNIIPDFDDARKMFDELDCIVCWDVREDDASELKKSGISLQPVEDRSWSKAETFPNSTHMLMIPNVHPRWVIDLKRVIERASEPPQTASIIGKRRKG